MEKSIRIVLANHHPIIRSDLRLLIERQPGFRVIGEAANGHEAVVLAEYRRPDIVLLDIKLPQVNGIVAAREISSNKPDLGIVFVTGLADHEYVSAAFEAGARGYVLANAAQTDLIGSIQLVSTGGCFLSPAIGAKLIDEHVSKSSSAAAVSEYERQICCFLAAGYGEQDIAALVNSTTSRVRVDCQNVADTVQQMNLPQVIVDSIRGNYHPAGKL